jgi:hypothetical protein
MADPPGSGGAALNIVERSACPSTRSRATRGPHHRVSSPPGRGKKAGVLDETGCR